MFSSIAVQDGFVVLAVKTVDLHPYRFPFHRCTKRDSAEDEEETPAIQGLLFTDVTSSMAFVCDASAKSSECPNGATTYYYFKTQKNTTQRRLSGKITS